MVRIDLLAFVDFVLTGGPKRLALAAPPRPEHFDFWKAWTLAVRTAPPDELAGAVNGAAGHDERRLRIYPRHAAALRSAIEAASATYAPTAEPCDLKLGDLVVDVAPDVALLVDRFPVDVFLWHRTDRLSAERAALILASAKLVGITTPGLIDLQHGARLVREIPGAQNPNDVTALLAAEAKTFLALRARAEARAK